MVEQVPGCLIALEGIDGCGKSTQGGRLIQWLQERDPGRSVVLLREPGGTPLGEGVRELLLRGAERGATTEMLLYMACRAELYQSRVLPALARGDVVLLDRSHFSTAAYQGAGLVQDEEAIFDLARVVTFGRDIDKVVLLDVDPEVAASRRQGESDRIESRGLPYFRRVAAAYRRYAEERPEQFLSIDASAAPDLVFDQICTGLSDVV
ncbi:MAG: dTMP kinase [Pseudohongiellaceae bacterium]|jgi:dTMP kinase